MMKRLVQAGAIWLAVLLVALGCTTDTPETATDLPAPATPTAILDADPGDGAARIDPETIDVLTRGMTAAERECFTNRLDDNVGNVTLLSLIDVTEPIADAELLSYIVIMQADCAPSLITGIFEQTAAQMSAVIGSEARQDVASCLGAELTVDSPIREDAMTVFIANANGLQIPQHTIDGAAQVMNRCIPADLLLKAMTTTYANDPLLAVGYDQACTSRLGPGLDATAYHRSIFTDNPLDEFEAFGTFTDALLTCISFGRIHAAEQGVDFATSEIDCLDDSLRNFASGRVEMALQGVSDAEAEIQRQELIALCLDPS